jgi:MFS family permease
LARVGVVGRAVRWLLQTEKPVPDRSDDEIAAQVARDYRWNFTVNVVEGAAFWFGFSFASTSTILPLFVSKLTPSPLAIGILAVLAQGSWYLPQIFTANATEKLARKKPMVINVGFFAERLPTWLWVVAAIVAGRSPAVALVVFLVGYGWHGLGAGLIAPAWQDLIARCFPVNRRGRLLGLTTFIGAGTGAIGAAFSAWLLASFAFPLNFVYTFAIAAGAITISWLWLALTREPVRRVTGPQQSTTQFWKGLPAIIRQDRNFRRFLAARSLMAVGGMGTGFVTVAAVRRWQIADSTAGVYTGVLLVGQTVSNLIVGWLADRFGHKLALELGAMTACLAFVLAWLAPSSEWFYAVFALLGVTLAAVIVSGILVVMEFSEPDRRPTYIGIANTGVGLVSLVSPLVGAWLASIGYSWLFAASACANLAALMTLHWWVQEPRWAASAVVRASTGDD